MEQENRSKLENRSLWDVGVLTKFGDRIISIVGQPAREANVTSTTAALGSAILGTMILGSGG